MNKRIRIDGRTYRMVEDYLTKSRRRYGRPITDQETRQWGMVDGEDLPDGTPPLIFTKKFMNKNLAVMICTYYDAIQIDFIAPDHTYNIQYKLSNFNLAMNDYETICSRVDNLDDVFSDIVKDYDTDIIN